MSKGGSMKQAKKQTDRGRSMAAFERGTDSRSKLRSGKGKARKEQSLNGGWTGSTCVDPNMA